MPRGVVPRQAARNGRQDKVGVGTGTSARLPGAKSRAPGRGEASAAALKGRPKTAKKNAPAPKIKSYSPVGPERVVEILRRLDQLYPDVTCALTHASAWELVVATILSAQSTDVNAVSYTHLRCADGRLDRLKCVAQLSSRTRLRAFDGLLRVRPHVQLS